MHATTVPAAPTTAPTVAQGTPEDARWLRRAVELATAPDAKVEPSTREGRKLYAKAREDLASGAASVSGVEVVR